MRCPNPGIESTTLDKDKRREPNSEDRGNSADGDGEQERAKDERDRVHANAKGRQIVDKEQRGRVGVKV